LTTTASNALQSLIETHDWWAGAAGALLGAAIGSGIPLWWSRRLRNSERRGEIIGMQVELQQAHIAISNLLLDAVAAPLYRLPLAISKQALPKLIGDAISMKMK
jgi:hypothetical protein